MVYETRVFWVLAWAFVLQIQAVLPYGCLVTCNRAGALQVDWYFAWYLCWYSGGMLILY